MRKFWKRSLLPPESAQRIFRMPISVNVMSGETIDGLGLASFDELATYVPNFMILESSSGLRIAMRGVGSGTNRGFEQSVGLFIDGIYSSRNKQFTLTHF